MAKFKLLSNTLPKVEVLSKNGQLVSSGNSNVVTVKDTGAIVKLSLDKSTLVGTKQVNDDLVLITKSGEEVIVENFFKVGDAKVVIEDQGELYVSNYDYPFEGLSFAAVESMDDVIAGTEHAMESSVWAVPLVILGVAGAAAAIIAGGSSDDNSSNNDGNNNNNNHKVDYNSKEDLDKTVEQMNALSANLDTADAALSKALTELKNGQLVKARSSAEDDAFKELFTKQFQSVEASKDAVAKLLQGDFQQQINNLEQFIKNASPALDTTEAKAKLAQAKETLAALTKDDGLLIQSDKAVSAAKQVLEVSALVDDALATESISGQNEHIKAALEAVAKAKANPTAENLAKAEQLVKAAQNITDPAVTKLKSTLDTINKLDKSNLLNDKGEVRADLQKYLSGLESKVSSALGEIDPQTGLDNIVELQAIIQKAQGLISEAKVAVKQSNDKVTAAKAALDTARAEMQEVLKLGDTQAVDAVNAKIKEANARYEEAKIAYGEAKTVYDNAKSIVSEAVEKGVNTSLTGLDALDNVSLTSIDSIESIDKVLEVDHQPSIFDVLVNAADNFVLYFKAIFDKALDTTIGHLITDSINCIGKVIGGIGDMIASPFNGIGLLVDSLCQFKHVVLNAIGKGINCTIESIWGSFNCIFGEVSNLLGIIPNAITGAIGKFFSGEYGMWILPSTWVNVANDVISKIVGGFWNSLTSIPGKIFAAIGEKIGKVASFIMDDIIGASWKVISEGVWGQIEHYFNVFIKNPFDFITGKVGSIMDIVTKFMSDPAAFFANLMKDGTEAVFQILDIVKGLFTMPGDAIEGFNKVVAEVMKAIADGHLLFGESKVITADVKAETEATAKEDVQLQAKSLLADLKVDADEALTLKSLLTDGKTDIDLSKVDTSEESAVAVNETLQSVADEAAAVIPQNMLLNHDDYTVVAA